MYTDIINTLLEDRNKQRKEVLYHCNTLLTTLIKRDKEVKEELFIIIAYLLGIKWELTTQIIRLILENSLVTSQGKEINTDLVTAFNQVMKTTYTSKEND